MKLGIFEHGWWQSAGQAASHDVRTLPVATHPSGNTHAADLAARLNNGTAVVDALRVEPVELLIDNGGVGLGFVTNPGQPDQLQMAHEVVDRPLWSHFIDPITTTFQGLD